MSRVRDRLTPILAGLVVLLVGVVVMFLLHLASDQGTKALTTAKVGQVNAIANSFNARYTAQLAGASGLGARPWDLTRGSKQDREVLQTFAVDPEAESGFFLIDANDTITGGILLREGRLGAKYTPPGWSEVKERLATDGTVATNVLNVGQTTELPNYAFIIGVFGISGELRGALVAEQALTASSPFQQEIAELATTQERTGAWYFLDSTGLVVASTQTSDIGRPAEDGRYRTSPAGLSEINGRVVITADVPALGWRVLYYQDQGEFRAPLSGPLTKVGYLLVVLMFGVALTLAVVFVRRLGESREQERVLLSLTRSQGEFISIVSHELRTPVAGVLGFLQTTMDHWTTLSDAERLSAVGRALTNAKRLESLTHEVLDIDWIESGRMTYALERLDLGTVLRIASENSEDIDASHPVQVTISDEAVVEVDPDRIQQVLSNLLDNSRKNSLPSEPIVVEAEMVDGAVPSRIRISVIDSGPGVDPEAAERLFEKFVRSNDNAVAGTGLGLYIARRIVEAHHGRIWCEPDGASNRTAFRFELPVVAPAPPQDGVDADIPRQARLASVRRSTTP